MSQLTRKESLRQRWVPVFRWMWKGINIFWVSIVFGAVLNVGYTWLVTPLKSINLNGTLLGWLVQHPLISGPIGISILGLTIIIGVTNYVLDQQIPQTPSDKLNRLNRKRFLSKLKFLYTGVLEQLLRNSVYMSLQLTKRTDAISNSFQHLLRQSHQSQDSLPPSISILRAYDEAEGELLILGQSGAGKTILLYELARELLMRAQTVKDHPLPVVLNFSSWVKKRGDIADWLVEEIAETYQISRSVSQFWISTNHILPLLDGLDEVPLIFRSTCIEGINLYRKNHLLPIVVCSRIDDYFLQQNRLTLHSAVAINPLTKQEVDTYLLQVGKSVEAIRTVLRRNVPLQELATTPLMLSILISAYRNKSVRSLSKLGSTNLQQQILEHYVARMFEHKGAKHRYTQQKTMYWLEWLAKQMKMHVQKELYLERLQTSWYPRVRFRRLYPSIVVGTVIGMFGWFGYGLYFGSRISISSGFIDGLIIGCCATFIYIIINSFLLDWLKEIKTKHQSNTGNRLRWVRQALASFLTNRVVYGLMFGIPIGSLIGFRIGMIQGVSSGVGYGLYNIVSLSLDFVLLGELSEGIHPAEHMSWSWRRAFQMAARFSVGGLIVGLSLGFLLVPEHNFNLNNALLLGLLCGLTIEILIVFIGGFSHEKLDEQRLEKPNQGIRRSLRNSIWYGTLGGCIGGLIFGCILALTENLVYGLIAGLSTAATLVQIIGLREGGYACLQHATLRFLLWRGGYAPWNYSRFLDYACDCILLCKVRGGYTFKHDLLLDYFASLNP